jgi:hypothetical protein
MHCYERTRPVRYNNFTDRDHFSSDGKLYIYNATESSQASPIQLVIDITGTWIKEKWPQVSFQKYGFGKLLIHNQTHLQFKTILIDSSSEDLNDSFMIARQF